MADRPRAFVNWAGDVRSAPVPWRSPRDADEVLETLVRARRRGLRVRPVGSGHSWSDAALPVGEALDLSCLRRILAIDGHARTARVEAGARIRDVSAAADRAGMALPILGSISEQTIAGAIATGTHGSSLVHGNLSSLVLEMTIATPGGDLVTLREGDPRLAAARVGLGALGVVVEVKLRLTPAFTLVGHTETLPIEEVADRLEEIGRGSELVKVWWLPGARGANVFRYERTDERPRDVRLSRALDEHVVNRHVFRLALFAVKHVPGLTLPLNRAVAASYLERPALPVRSDLAFNVPMPPKHRETEYAFGLDDAAAVVRETAALIRRERLRVTFPFEIRFVRGDDAWMSPAYGRDTCQLGAYAADSPDLARFFSAFEDLAVSRLGRPHWGKEARFDAAYVTRTFPMAESFRALARSWDPDGTLRNPFLDRVLG